MFQTDYLCFAEYAVFRDTPALTGGQSGRSALCCVCGHYIDQTAADSTVSKTHWAILLPSQSLHPVPLQWKLHSLSLYQKKKSRLSVCECVLHINPIAYTGCVCGTTLILMQGSHSHGNILPAAFKLHVSSAAIKLQGNLPIL